MMEVEVGAYAGATLGNGHTQRYCRKNLGRKKGRKEGRTVGADKTGRMWVRK